jgi:hypothetical protein
MQLAITLFFSLVAHTKHSEYGNEEQTLFKRVRRDDDAISIVAYTKQAQRNSPLTGQQRRYPLKQVIMLQSVCQIHRRRPRRIPALVSHSFLHPLSVCRHSPHNKR